MLNENETALPGSALTPRQVRILKIAIAIMTVMLIAGFILLFIGIYLQSNQLSGEADGGRTAASSLSEGAIIDLPVAQGAAIHSMHVNEGRIILQLRGSSGSEEISIINLKTGMEQRRIRLAPQQ